MKKSSVPDAVDPHGCTGLIVRIGVNGQPSTALSITAAEVARGLHGKWTVEELAPGSRIFTFSRADKEISTSRAWSMSRDLVAHHDVEWAEPALEAPGLEPAPAVGAQSGGSSQEPPKAVRSDRLWALRKSKVIAAWSLSPAPGGRRYGEGIVVAHPDTGYRRHKEFYDEDRLLIADGYDFVNRDPTAIDTLEGRFGGHGTRTGSVLMSGRAHATKTSGLAGAAPLASLIPLRVSDSVIHLRYTRLTRALYYATERGAHVVSMSLGGIFKSRALHAAVQHAVNNGVILVAAAGNYWPWCAYPARFPETVALAAHDYRFKVWSGSAGGRPVDLAAPGKDVWCASPPSDDLVITSSGTSYATALTAGTAALWLAFHGRERLIERYGRANLASVFKAMLLEHGVVAKSNWDTGRYGDGYLDACALLEASLPNTPPAALVQTVRARGAATVYGGEMEELLDYFEDDEHATVRTNIERTLAAASKSRVESLVAFADELGFHIATDPAFRERLRHKSGEVVAAQKVSAATPKAASRELKTLLKETTQTGDGP